MNIRGEARKKPSCLGGRRVSFSRAFGRAGAGFGVAVFKRAKFMVLTGWCVGTRDPLRGKSRMWANGGARWKRVKWLKGKVDNSF
jgi:hypothetical protein